MVSIFSARRVSSPEFSMPVAKANTAIISHTMLPPKAENTSVRLPTWKATISAMAPRQVAHEGRAFAMSMMSMPTKMPR